MALRSRIRRHDWEGIGTRRRRWVGALVLLLAASAIIAGCGASKSPTILQPAGPIASREAGLFWFILIVATFIFVTVISALLYSVIRFRARPGSPPARQIHGNTKLEIAWTIVPSAVLFGVLIATITTMFALAQPASAQTLTVTAIGHQWWWEFQYPNQKIVTADELHIPLNTVVHVDLRSDDVIHSFWVPQLGGKTDVVPGHDNSLWLQAAKAGEYRGECAEFCGVQHAHMDFVVVAQSASAYQAWVTSQQAGPATPTTTLAQTGAQDWKTSPCIACHIINSVNNLQNPVGPNLTHFGSRLLVAGGVLDNNPTNLRNWINDAQTIKPGVDMPTFAGSLQPGELDALVAYLESLK